MEIHDDGVGFDVDRPASGFGVSGMRERVYLAHGTLEIESAPGSTVVRAVLPVAGEGAERSRPQQSAS